MSLKRLQGLKQDLQDQKDLQELKDPQDLKSYGRKTDF